MLKPAVLAVFILLTACQPKNDENAASAPESPPPAEIGNPELIEKGKAGLAAMTAGDIDAFIANYADNARYNFNNGDSLVGKQAIYDYWKQRRAETITSIEFSNQVWLPVKVNTPQATEQSGDWLLGWYLTKATYTTGKSMTQWIHTDHHFNADGKIDQTIQYLDRSVINAAMTK